MGAAFKIEIKAPRVTKHGVSASSFQMCELICVTEARQTFQSQGAKDVRVWAQGVSLC